MSHTPVLIQICSRKLPTVLDLKRSPPSGRCCSRCTPDLLSRYPASDRHDAWLKMFASDFLFLIPTFSRRQRMDSVSSTDSRSTAGNHSPTRPTFIPFTHKVQLCKEQRDDLVAALDKWRIEKQARRAGGRSLFSKQVFLPDAQLKKIADHGGDFLRAATVTPDLIGKFAQLDLASNEDLKDMASVIMDWRPDAQLAIGLTPRGGHRQKQQNTAMSTSRSTDETPRRPMQPIAQPSFSPARLARGRPRGRGRGRGAGAAARQPQTTTVNASDVFAPAMSSFTIAPNPPPIHPSPHSVDISFLKSVSKYGEVVAAQKGILKRQKVLELCWLQSGMVAALQNGIMKRQKVLELCWLQSGMYGEVAALQNGIMKRQKVLELCWLQSGMV
ncbi:hypothetical protein B0H13DRAFT_1901102 [Mycena leptocephala]|nr:hypothetical protein B0H13DRAFT_1901102 [Mycena leptocephala]